MNASGLPVDVTHLSQNAGERFRALEVSQARCVGRANINDGVVRRIPQDTQNVSVIGSSIVQSRFPVLSEIDSKDTGKALTCEPVSDNTHTFTRKPESVNQSVVLRNAPQSWSIVTGLWQRCNSTDLDRAK